MQERVVRPERDDVPGVFISYRRSDTALYAARLKEHLSGTFGVDYVFMDVDSLRPGEPFPDVIDATITSSDAVLALIGRDWLQVTDAAGRRRLDDPGDFVRIELATALRFDRVVIPVLLGRASMPAESELPESLVALAERHAIEMSDDRWDGDLHRLVHRLEEVVDTIPPCPYPGMVQFRREETDRFFGRTAEIAAIDDRMRTQRLLCLVGPSGCGKSSLLEAGVLANLERTEPGRWAVCTMRPGALPTRALGDALGAPFSGGDPAADSRRAVDHALAGVPEAVRVLLVVDQLEELFAQADADEHARFVDALEAIHELHDATLVLAIRADFYGELMESALWPLVERGKVDVPPLAGESLAEAITEPAEACHVTIEPDLLERLLGDAGKEPGALPLLQETLVRLWETMRLRRIGLSAYGQLGADGGSAMSAAVSDTADAAIDALAPRQAAIAKRVLLRLVQFGEGRPDTRRQLRLDDLRSEGDEERMLEDVLDHLARFRVVTPTGSAPSTETDGDDGAGVATSARVGMRVDLAHEALIGAWPTMRGWVADRREAEQARRRLEDRVEAWDEHDRAAAFLDAVQLREAKGWLAGADARELGVPPGLPELVATSDARLARRRRVRFAAIAGLVGLLIVSLVLAGVFLRARNDAIHKANVALSRERAAGALASLSVDPHRSLRLAIQAADALAHDGRATASDRREAEAALRDAIRTSNVRGVLRGHTAEVVSASFSSDGSRVVTASWDGTARLWNAHDFTVEAVLEGHRARLEDAVISPDATLVATAGDDGTARLWHASDGASAGVLQHEPRSHVLAVSFSPDGRSVVTASSAGTARIWDTAMARLVATLIHARNTPVRDATFSPDGRLVATAGDDGRTILWSTSTWKQVARLADGAGAVTMARFSPDGASIAAADADGTAHVWRTRPTAAKPVVLRGHKGEVVSVDFSPDGRRVATASLDGTVRVWDPRTGVELTVPLVHGDSVRRGTFSPGGSQILTASADHTARIWDARTGEELVAFRGHDDFVGTAAYSPDGRTVVTSSFDGTARLWDAAGSQPAVTIGSERLSLASAALSPDGGRILTTSPDAHPGLWDSRTGALASTLAARGARIVTATFGTDGREVATADTNGIVRIWDSSSGGAKLAKRASGDVEAALLSPDGSRIAALSVSTADAPTSTVTLWSRGRPAPVGTRILDGVAQGAAFSADGKKLAAWTQSGAVRVWDARDGHALATLPHPAAVRSASFSPDGTDLATAGDDDAARIWTIANGRQLRRVRQAFAVVSAVFSSDGDRLLTASLDSTARLWDVHTGGELVSFRGHDGELSGASFSPSDRWVVTAGLDGTARVWDAHTGQEIALFRHPGEVVSAMFDHDGRRVLTLAADGRARMFRCETCVPLDELVRLARSRLVAGLD